jgi:hypothetical protein
MHPSWRIPAEAEESFREALNLASTRRVSELHIMLERLPEEQLAGIVGLCGFVTAYTAIDVVERRWPTDAGLHRMAQGITEGENRDEQFGVTEQNLYLWLSQCALGFRAYAEVFGDLFDDPYKFLAAPFFFTVNVLIRFRPKETPIGDFLDMIEDAYEKAWLLDLNLLPALMVRARMPQPQQASDTSAGSR